MKVIGGVNMIDIKTTLDRFKYLDKVGYSITIFDKEWYRIVDKSILFLIEVKDENLPFIESFVRVFDLKGLYYTNKKRLISVKWCYCENSNWNEWKIVVETMYFDTIDNVKFYDSLNYMQRFQYDRKLHDEKETLQILS